LRHPPSRAWYTDRSRFEFEMREIFGRAWLVVCHGSDVAEPGSYLTARIGGQEIALVRGRDDVLRCFHNVCQHRAHRLLEGQGMLKATITCPYHAWAYGLNGTLRSAPNMAHVGAFETSDFPLSSVRTTMFAGFVMLCHDDATPEPKDLFGDLEERLLADHPQLPAMKAVRTREAVLDANWKAVIENYLECYHCDTAHPSFGNFDMTTWKHVWGEGWSRQGRVPADKAGVATSQDDLVGLSAWWQWPAVFWARALGPESFVVARHEPLSENQTRQTRVVYSVDGKETGELKDFNDLFDTVFAEDVSVVESVQRGLGSRGYRGGVLIEDPDRSAGWSEHAVGRFQAMVRDAHAANTA
jgi:phenylpropionate dioxygenase-like ring-hydroxylating dioxygenase large terminal subunit